MTTKADYRIVFMGTAEFAVPALRKLYDDGWQIAEVVTQPDEPVGRKQVLTPPPVKVEAEKLGLSVYQPSTLKSDEAQAHFENLRPDVIIVAAYGKMIPKWLLELPSHGCLNIHPSLLPKYRGPSPIQAAILNGDTVTGVTIMLLDEEMDHGKIVAQKELGIMKHELRIMLESRLAKLGAELLVDVLPDYLDGTVPIRPQDHEQAIFTKLITREDGKIDWHQPAAVIERTARAYEDWPGIWTTWNGKRLKLLKISVFHEQIGCAGNPTSGYIWQTEEKNKKLTVNCQPGSVVLEEVQLEGREPMIAQEFLRGYLKIVGQILK